MILVLYVGSTCKRMLCKIQVLYIYTGARAHRGPTQYGPGSGPVFLDRLGCTGKEDALVNCEHRPLGFPNTDCTHLDDAGVECPGKRIRLCLV